MASQPISPPSADWGIGDLALCHRLRPWRSLSGGYEHGPRLGDIRYVTGIVRFWPSDGSIAEYLSFASWPGALFEIEEFTRITPQAEVIERADQAFIAGLLSQPQPAVCEPCA